MALTTLSRNLVDGGSDRRKDLYLTTHETHNRQTSMPPAAFEPTFPVNQRRQTNTYDGMITGLSLNSCLCLIKHYAIKARRRVDIKLYAFLS
jgi:hypothetical protein